MFLENYLEDIQALCESRKVKSLYAFGSVLTKQFNVNSDVDLIVDIDEDDPIVYAESYFDLKFKLEELMQKPIDLLEKKGLKNRHLLQVIEQTKQVVYES